MTAPAQNAIDRAEPDAASADQAGVGISPLLDALRTLHVKSPALTAGLAPGLVVEDPNGWDRATDLVQGRRLGAFLGAPSDRWGAATHVSAALAWKAYVYWLALPAVVGYLTGCAVPLLNAENVVLRPISVKPYIRVGIRRVSPVLLAGPGPSPPASSQPAFDDLRFAGELRSTLVDQHLAPLAQEIKRCVRLGDRALWGSLAAAVGKAGRRIGHLSSRSHTVSGITALLEVFGVAPLIEITSCDGNIEMRRKTCCLAFTVPALKFCSGCCVVRGRSTQGSTARQPHNSILRDDSC